MVIHFPRAGLNILLWVLFFYAYAAQKYSRKRKEGITMAIIRRNALSDALGLTREGIESFEFNKTAWHKLCKAAVGNSEPDPAEEKPMRKYHGDTDGDASMSPMDMYKFIVRDPVLSFCNPVEKHKRTWMDLRLEWIQKDYEPDDKMFSPDQRYWREKQDFFLFVVNHDNVSGDAVIQAATDLISAMRKSQVNEALVDFTVSCFVMPAIRKFITR